MMLWTPSLRPRPRGDQLSTAHKAVLRFLAVTVCVLALSAEARAEPRFEILDRAMVDNVEQAYVRYPSGDLQVTGWIFVNPFGEIDVEPALIFCHGGVGGVSESTRAKCRWLAQQGYIVFAPSYRGEDDGEGEIEIAAGEVDDVVNAILELRSHPGIESDKFVLLGLSHGALISVKAAARPELQGVVQAVAAAYGVMDIYSWYQHLLDNDFDVSDPISQRVYGSGPADKPEAFAMRHALGVIDQLSEAPILLVQGGQDKIIPRAQATTMIAAMRETGRLQDRIKIYPNVGHGFLYWDDPKLHEQIELREAKVAWQDILSFFQEFVGHDDYEG